MSPRTSRRRELLAVALAAFRRQGYDGTGIAEIATSARMTKAAVTYHFPAKSDLLLALVDPLVDALEQVLESARVADAGDRDRLLSDYFDVLTSFAAVSDWVHSDRSVQSHPSAGPRLEGLFERAVALVAGPDADPSARIAAATAVTSLWASTRYLDGGVAAVHRDTVLQTVLRGLAPRTA